MKKNIYSGFLIIVFAAGCFSQSDPAKEKNKIGLAYAAKEIKGWQVPGQTDSQNYDIFLDTTISHHGKASATLRSRSSSGGSPNNTFLSQTFKANDYLNSRVRLTIFAKTENAERATFWMRIEGEGMRVMNTDNMDSRPITGTSDWKEYDIVLDVPGESHQIVLGASLKGEGQIWLDDIKFEQVAEDVTVTSTRPPAETEAGSLRTIEKYRSTNKDAYDRQIKGFLEKDKTLPLRPVNLDFEN